MTAGEAMLGVNGTRLFVDVRGPEDAPPLLFIHGGPGQSCYDFMYMQGDRLAERLRVIGLDQRGVLRSDPLPELPPLTVETLLDDFEAVREALGIESWTILGHSAGGAFAIRYAHRFPDRVRAAIYDCPCWDGDRTDRYRLPVAADLLDRYGEPEAAKRCRTLATKPERLTAGDETRPALQKLGDHYNELFFHQPDALGVHERIFQDSGFGEEDWGRGRCHQPLLAQMYDSKLPLLPELRQPSLLVHGRYDLVTPPSDVELFRRTAGAVHTFEQSGHFAYTEQPDEYADVISAFVVAHARD